MNGVCFIHTAKKREKASTGDAKGTNDFGHFGENEHAPLDTGAKAKGKGGGGGGGYNNNNGQSSSATT